MKRFTAQINDMSYINVPADHMELVDNTLRVYDGRDLVAVVEITAVVTAHISERGEKQ